jgi:hypothetical protein
MVDTLMPESTDKERVVALVQEGERFLEAMLDDERLFERLMSGEEILLRISPWLLFTVLLRRARRDLEEAAFTTERRSLQKMVLFDTDEVADLLDQDVLRGYLATLLASFTDVERRKLPLLRGRGMRSSSCQNRTCVL